MIVQCMSSTDLSQMPRSQVPYYQAIICINPDGGVFLDSVLRVM